MNVYMANKIDAFFLYSLSLLVIYKTIVNTPRKDFVFTRENRILLFLKIATQYLRGMIQVYTLSTGYKIKKKIDVKKLT